jgi:uncharacterized caspase-like protein
MAKREEDFAILVGIDKYQMPDLNRLEGARADARAFRAWLWDDPPFGGGLPRRNVKLIEGDENGNAPTAARIEKAFRLLLRRAPSNTPRVGRRLYVFMSGHGASHEQHRLSDVGLLPATFGDDENFYIVAQLFVEALQKRGAFDEFFLFMDCCRELAPMPLTIMQLGINQAIGDLGPCTSTLTAYASQYAAKAREREFPGQQGEKPCKRGIFTMALLEALRGWAVEKETGTITKDSLDRYLVSRVPYYSAVGALQKPQVDGARDLVIVEGPLEAKPTRVVVRFGGPIPDRVEFSLGDVKYPAVVSQEATASIELEGLRRWIVSAPGYSSKPVSVAGEEVIVALP